MSSTFRFGAQLYTVRDRCQTPEDYRETMRIISAIGYNGVQVSGQNPSISARSIRASCDEAALEIVCTHVPFDDLKDNLDKIIQDHRIYDCKYPGLGSMPMRYYEDGISSLKLFARTLNGIADKLAERGMRLLYHNHAHEFQRFDGVLAFDVLQEECNENVQFEIDTYWVQCGGGNPVKYLRGRSADIIHFKDMLGTARNASEICTVGRGNLDWPEIIKACRETRVKWAMVEQDNAAEQGNSIRALESAYNYLVSQGVEP